MVKGRARALFNAAGWLLWGAAFALSTAGCERDPADPPRTIRVAVSTDAADKFDRFKILVTRSSEVKFNRTYDRAMIDELPDSLLLTNATPADDKGNYITTPIEVRITAISAGSEGGEGGGGAGGSSGADDEVLIERSHRLSFVLTYPVLLRVPLCDACIGVFCGVNETCIDGACVDNWMALSALVKDDGSQPLEGPECPAEAP